jgi:hypothetical protein
MESGCGVECKAILTEVQMEEEKAPTGFRSAVQNAPAWDPKVLAETKAANMDHFLTFAKEQFLRYSDRDQSLHWVFQFQDTGEKVGIRVKYMQTCAAMAFVSQPRFDSKNRIIGGTPLATSCLLTGIDPVKEAELLALAIPQSDDLIAERPLAVIRYASQALGYPLVGTYFQAAAQIFFQQFGMVA